MPPWRLVPDHPTHRCSSARSLTCNAGMRIWHIPAQFTAFLIFCLGSSAAPDTLLLSFVLLSVIARLLIKAHFSTPGEQCVPHSQTCVVFILLAAEGPKLKSRLSVPPLKAANSWPLSYLLLSQTPQTIINTTFCQTQSLSRGLRADCALPCAEYSLPRSAPGARSHSSPCFLHVSVCAQGALSQSARDRTLS